MVFVAVLGAGGSFLKIFIDAFDIVRYVLQCLEFGAFSPLLKAFSYVNAINAGIKVHFYWTLWEK